MNLHHSDVSGTCMGTDTSLMTIAPLAYKEVPIDRRPEVFNDVLTEITVPAFNSFADNFTRSLDCQTTSFCNPVKISSPQPISCLSTGVTVNLHRNAECGVRPIWSFDTSVISKATYLNDTTLHLNFLRPWQGYIHASLNSCYVSEDSIKLSVFDSPSILDLGPDTVICQANTITLNARSGYLTYIWQDGSADSVFFVKEPGQYFVKVTDGCGNLFSDTVLVRSAPASLFDIGTDKTKCNTDSVHVIAPSGFVNYQWAPSDGISDSKVSDVFLFPINTTRYTITAEKTKGCFVYDSITIYVNHSPLINLGADTTLCDGQSLIISAGSGFANYNWSNQAATSAIKVSTAGKYFVSATDINACISKDTINITVNTTPYFSLGNDTTLCDNQSILLQASVPGDYLWQDGTIQRQKNVTNADIYWLQVSRDKCLFRDSISVKYTALPKVSLGNDTTLCDSDTLQLDVTQDTSGATYQWQDGSSKPTYTVYKAGSYYVTVIQNGCRNTDRCEVSYLQRPKLNLGANTVKCQDDIIRLSAFADNAVYQWNDNSTTSFLDVVKAGTYYCTVSNFCGSASDTIIVSNRVCECEPIIPNAFSPNGDGVNDLFRPVINCTPDIFLMQILDRGGQIIFETTAYDHYWDGTFHNKPVPVGIYYYLLRIKGSSEFVPKIRNGSITLIR